MRKSAEYLKKLAEMKNNIYLGGKVIGRDDPRVVKGSKAIQLTFDLVDDPKYEKLLKTTSHISGKTINRFTHIHQSSEDLMIKQEMTRELTRLVGGCIQRCMGIDAMNAL